MQICCTKDLQQELGINAEAGLEGNDLFCWRAHIITVNRRKAVLEVNDSNRFGFVLYGLKAKELKNLMELFIQILSMRNTEICNNGLEANTIENLI